MVLGIPGVVHGVAIGTDVFKQVEPLLVTGIAVLDTVVVNVTYGLLGIVAEEPFREAISRRISKLSSSAHSWMVRVSGPSLRQRKLMSRPLRSAEGVTKWC